MDPSRFFWQQAGNPTLLLTETLDSRDNKALVWLFRYPEEPRRCVPAEIDVAIIGAWKLEHLHKAGTTGKASVILAASIFHFGQISMSEAKQCLEERGIPINMERTWLLTELGR